MVFFLSDPGVPGVRSMDPDVSNYVSKRGCWNLTDMVTDVTLADQATKSIPTDVANMQVQVNVAIKVTQPGG